MMTTFAAIGGGLPLALGHRRGLGAAPAARHRHRRRPAGVAVAHPLHTPVVYLYFDRFAHWLSGKRAAAGEIPANVPAQDQAPGEAGARAAD